MTLLSELNCSTDETGKKIAKMKNSITSFILACGSFVFSFIKLDMSSLKLTLLFYLVFCGVKCQTSTKPSDYYRCFNQINSTKRNDFSSLFNYTHWVLQIPAKHRNIVYPVRLNNDYGGSDTCFSQDYDRNYVTYTTHKCITYS